MIYKFKCPATETVHMSQMMAEFILEKIGHTSGPTGVITVEQMEDAISALKTKRSGTDESTRSAILQHSESMIRMLEHAKMAGQNITWGV